MPEPGLKVRGFQIYKGLLDVPAQAAMIEDLREVMRLAPPYSPETPYGKKMSVRMTSAGEYGWYSDASGYRYEKRHPSGAKWPPIPDSALKVWQQVAGVARMPESCLVNFYGEGAKMGMHRDMDEADMRWPVVSISLGDDGLFRMGGLERMGTTDAVWLNSGDVVVIGGTARRAYHGVDRIRFGSSGLMPRGGRVNVTLRVVS